MPIVEVKKCKVTYVQVLLKDCHPDCSWMTDNGASWKNRERKNLILGIRLTWTSYDNTSKDQTILAIMNKAITDPNIDYYIRTKIISVLEDNLQNDEVESRITEIVKKDEYRGP